MLRTIAGVIAGVLLMVAPAAAGAEKSKANRAGGSPPIRHVVSFGDSWSSANVIFGTLPGPAWPQLLASKYGDVQKADTEGGLNFARGGAFVAPIAPYSNADTPTPVTAQIDAYLAKHGRFDPDQLVTIWAGGNDLFAYAGSWSDSTLDAFCKGTQGPAQLNTMATQVAGVAKRQMDVVREVLKHGARHVALLDLVDIGLTAMDPCLTPDGTAITGVLTKIENLATRVELTSSGLGSDPRVAFVPISDVFYDIAARPADYGFKVVDGDGCASGFSCAADQWKSPDADRSYVFAGSGHFTAHSRELIAARVRRAADDAWGRHGRR